MYPRFHSHRSLSAVASRRLATAFVCVLIGFRAFGLNPHHRLTQYAHTVWRIEDGVFSGTPSAVAQTKDGYIWIGTRAGLMRFDGVQFTAFHPSPKERLRSPVISSLLAAQDGSLWIGTGSYLAHFKDGDLTSYLDALGNISTIKQDREGTIWFTRTRTGADQSGGLCRVTRSRTHCYGDAEGMPLRIAQPLEEGDARDWWIAGSRQLVHWNNGSSVTIAPAGLNTQDQLAGFTSLARDSDGSVWAGVAWRGNGLGLQHIVDGKLVPFVNVEMDSSHLEVDALFFDRDHSLWVGTSSGGVYRISGGRSIILAQRTACRAIQ